MLHLRQSSTFLCSSIDTSTYPLPTGYSRSILCIDVLFSSLLEERAIRGEIWRKGIVTYLVVEETCTGSLKKKNMYIYNMRYSMIEAVNAIFFPYFSSYSTFPRFSSFSSFLGYVLYLFLTLYLFSLIVSSS